MTRMSSTTIAPATPAAIGAIDDDEGVFSAEHKANRLEFYTQPLLRYGIKLNDFLPHEEISYSNTVSWCIIS